MKYDVDAWYAIRVTYCRELKLKEYLEKKDIKYFLPMRYEIKIKHGKKIKEIVPVIHNLIFIYTTRAQLDFIKPKTEEFAGMRYIMDRTINEPITIPNVQMQNFIAVSESYDEDLRYLSNEEMGLIKGDKVRITNGVFAGVEGVFVKLNGTRARRVVVEVAGIAAVATTSIDSSSVEKI
ncbi:MAG: UpxY family transcription antiterminator [Rikenellaceae bacterium]